MFSRRKLPASVRLAPFPARYPLFVTFIVLLALWAYLDRSGGIDDGGRYHDQLFNVVAVMDGDTFDIDLPDQGKLTTRIRLWGVDTPEISGSPGGAMHFGAEASAFTKSWLSNRKVRLVLSPTKSRDRYGRLLAYVYLPDSSQEMLNERLLETGHAYAELRFDHPHRRRFETLEKRARLGKVGLWKNLTPEQIPEWRQKMEGERSVADDQ